MWIICITTFRDNKDSFIKGELRYIEKERGDYFVQNAWAVETIEPNLADLPEAGQESTTTYLDIQSGILNLGDNYG
jgi:hypothetical protein